MEQNELNRLAECYRIGHNQRMYVVVYRSMTDLQIVNRRSLVRSHYGDENDADELFDRVFDRVINSKIATDFMRMLSKSLRNARVDFIRREKRRRNRLVSLDDPICKELDAPTLGSTLESEEDTEKSAINKVKRAEYLAAIDSLLDPTTDHVTTAIVTFIHRYDSRNALAKELAVHHSVVSRKLNAFIHKFEKEYGDIRDYLAV